MIRHQSTNRRARIVIPLLVGFGILAAVTGDWITALGTGMLVIVEVLMLHGARRRSADRSDLRVNEPLSMGRFFKSAAFPILVIVVAAFAAKHLGGG